MPRVPFGRAVVLLAGLVGLSGLLSAQSPAVPGDAAYLFTYFTGNGEDGLHLARSDDGTRWRRVAGGRSWLAPEVGGRLMRDPSLVRGPDGVFHLVWTTGWWDRGFGVAHSSDLKTWSAQTFVPVLTDEAGLQNVWAPEIHHDAARGEFLVVWASTITGRFSETAGSGDKGRDGPLNHRLYATTTTDFRTWTPARVFYDDGFNVIDGVIVRDATAWRLIVKDETRHPVARKHLRVATGDRLAGPFGPAGPAVSVDWVEGPTVLRLGDRWRVYFDEYTRKRYGALDTRDFGTFTAVPDLVMPDGVRHGTALAVPRALIDALDRL